MANSSKRIRYTVIAVILLTAISYWIIRNNQSGSIRRELYEFGIDDTSKVTRIYMINTGGQEVTLDRMRAGEWKVNDKFRARNDAINNLLVCIRNLEVRQPVARSAVENVSKDLATSSTKVEIYEGKELVRVYYVGADTQDGLGTFMLLSDPKTGENSTLPFVMFIPGFNGFLSVRYFIDEDSWRDRAVFRLLPDEIESITLDYPFAQDSGFTLHLAKDYSIKVNDSRGREILPLDTMKARRYVTYYSNIHYESLQNDRRQTYKDSILGQGPAHIIMVKDRSGKIHTVKTFVKPHDDPNRIDEVTGQPIKEDKERMFALVNEEKDLALIQFYVFGKLMVSPNYFKAVSAGSVKPAVKK